MRIQRKLILLLARDLVLFRNVLAGDAHVIVVVNIPQTILDHGINDLRIAQAIALARLRQKIRRVGHGFHATGDHDFAVAGLNGLRAQCDSLQSRAAHFIDCHSTDFRRQAAENRRLARGILSQAGGDHVAHDAFIHLRRVYLGALHRLAHHYRAELRGAPIGQRALELSHRGAHPGDDDNIVILILRHTVGSCAGFPTLHYKMEPQWQWILSR